MISNGIDESIFHHIEMMFSKTTFEFRRDGLEKALVKVLSEKEIIHINELLNRIFFELLHSDLSDVIYPTLPNLDEFQNGYIAQNGPILLEIVECIEVGISTYKLLQILDEFESSQANNAEDGSEKRIEFPRKMLHLLLSDGQQQIKGMEYKQISELSLHTPIGKKVLINNVKYGDNMLFLTPENTYVCEGFEWTSRRLGDLKLTFMELLGMATNENVEDESQISYNALHPFDVQPIISPSNMGGRLSRVIFENVPNMPDLTKLKRFLLKAETSNPPPRSVPPYNKTSLERDFIVRTSSLHQESSFNNTTRPNSVTRMSLNNTMRPNSLAKASSCAEPPFINSMRSDANEEPPHSEPSYIMSSRLKNVTKSSFTKPTFKAPLRQFNVDTPSPNPSSKSICDEPAFKAASSWDGPAEELSCSQPALRNASTLYTNQEAALSTETAFKKSSTLYNPPSLLSTTRPTFRSSSPIEEKTSFIEPSFNASSIRSNSGEKASFNNRLSYNNTPRSHLSMSSNELDFNVSPIQPNSRFKEPGSKVSYSMYSNPGVDPFSIQDDDISYMLIEDDNNEKYNDKELYSKKAFIEKNQNRDDFHNDDGVIIIDSDRPIKDLCNNVITESTKNNLASLFESLENEYKAISDANLPPVRDPSSIGSNHNKNKRSWLYEEIDCDNDMGLDDAELPPVKRVSRGIDEDGGSLANPIVLDYDDNDYEMDLDEILSGYTEC
ncbi:hypothetical protein C1645_826422 [Glomus cerebriforme]|uniref:RecQ-mediated genome instability protein 1 n=1 Tax=Glomus cerebriforme TaxID=658196 RepID=A0A397SQF5_9GLOM|nr:hypothetical protein C1645_826422 [Glomus cerebriforme]